LIKDVIQTYLSLKCSWLKIIIPIKYLIIRSKKRVLHDVDDVVDAVLLVDDAIIQYISNLYLSRNLMKTYCLLWTLEKYKKKHN
jgi:hypothetical protein